jgi:flagellar hook assembly protein FlgD
MNGDFGTFSLKVYNSAGELIRTLEEKRVVHAFNGVYSWDGTNKAGSRCASGVYIIYMIAPLEQRMVRVVLINK